MSFFVSAMPVFLGVIADPYKSLKTPLKADINAEIWQGLYFDVSLPFTKLESGCIAIKVINHLGDGVIKVFEGK